MDPGPVLAILICLSIHNGFASGQKHLNVTYDNHGQYQIMVDNVTWLAGAQTYFTVNAKTLSTSDGSLKLENITKSKGFDRIGSWKSVNFIYKASDITIEAFIKSYDELDAVVFGQHFPNGSAGMSVGDRNKLSSAFPNFKVPSSGSGFDLGYLAYGGMMIGELKQKFGRFGQKTFTCTSGVDGGPLVLFDSKSNATIISSFSNFMVGVPYFNTKTGEYGWGLQGELQSVPMGFTYETSIFYGQGIRRVFDSWGYNIKQYYGKTTKLRDSDFTNNYLSYWTDNGAYYVQYYAKGQRLQNMTYEESLIKYKSYADQLGTPFRSMQYSVWYKTEINSTMQGPTVVYEPDSKMIPDGMDYMREHIKLPITSHNRYWSSKTTYAKQNGGKYNFIVENSQALPQDQQFWTDLFNQMKRWEFSNYMQDWLDMPPQSMNATVSDPFVLRNWLLQMGRGASENDMTIQYCMSLPMHILQSLEIPSVTQARASNDYQPNSDRDGSEQWRIGITSLFADAVGLAPFKDTFWTTTNQTGNYYKGSELYPGLQAAVSSLSAGPVGPGDMINGTNATLLMRCCNADGLILKPARPARAIDDQLKQMTLGSASNPIGPIGQVWTTYTEIGEYAFGIIFATEIQNSYNITPMEAFYTEDHFMVYSYTDVIPVYVQNFSAQHPLNINKTCTKEDFCLFYTTPIIKLATREIYLLGEFGKWVPMSAKRFTDITVTDTDMFISVVGGPDEQVGIHFVYLDYLGYTYVWVDCHLSDAGTATLDVVKHRCY